MAYKVLDIANTLLRYAETSEGEEDFMTNMKLQKMLYYQQGFHLAYFGTPLFDEEIEAWMYGPVVPCVFENYKSHGRNGIEADKDRDFQFKDRMEASLFAQVYKIYGKYSALGLMEMTHEELPWKSTTTGKGNIIEKDKLLQFFRTQITQ